MSEGLFMRISPADWQDSFLLLLLNGSLCGSNLFEEINGF